MVNCPVCDGVLDIEEDELDEGDEFTCDECGAELSVSGTDPLEIEAAADADDDEDDDDLDEDEEDEDEDEELEEDDEDEDDDWK
jgi:lysine biosynthesis protein LysW